MKKMNMHFPHLADDVIQSDNIVFYLFDFFADKIPSIPADKIPTTLATLSPCPSIHSVRV
jgi:hypothetical protein